MANIKESLTFNPNKVSIHKIKKTENTDFFVVGLTKEQVLKKHKTSIPAILVVLKGTIDFEIEGKIIHFNEFDTFNIPVDVMHEVTGIGEENMFAILKC